MEIAQVTALMEQKKKALREFQAVTQKMLECSRDDLKKTGGETGASDPGNGPGRS